MIRDRLRPNLRREMILVCLALAEMCWFTPWFLALSGRARGLSPGLVFLECLGFVLAAFAALRLLHPSALSLRIQRVILCGCVIVSVWLALHFWLYPAEPWWPATWILRPFRLIFEPGVLVPEEFLIFAAVVYLWWRGLRLSDGDASIWATALSLRLGTLLFVGFMLLGSPLAQVDPSPFLPPFFFLTLVAGSLSRIETLRSLWGGGTARFGRFWFAVTVVGALGALALGAVLTALLRSNLPGQIVLFLLPVIVFLINLVLFLLSPLFSLLINLILALIDLLRQLNLGGWWTQFMQFLQQVVGAAQQSPNRPPPVIPPEIVEAFGVAKGTTYLLCGSGLILLMILALSRIRLRSSGPGDYEDAQESLLRRKGLRQGLRRAIGGALARLGLAQRLVSRFEAGRRLLAAFSIRHIYAQMARLSAQRGYPRALAQTPYEYLPALLRAFPGGEMEAQQITEAYVQVHYGERSDTDFDLPAVRQAWKRLQATTGVAGH